MDRDTIGDRDSGQKQLVFVVDVEIVKETKAVKLPTLSIIERLQPLDQCKCCVSNPIFEILSPLKSRSILQDRELHNGGLFLNSVGVLSVDETEKQMIKCSSGIMEAVSDHHRPVNKIRNGIDLEVENEFPRLVIRSLDDGIGFSFTGKIGNGGFESLKVFLCPSNLGAITNGQFSYDLAPYYGEE